MRVVTSQWGLIFLNLGTMRDTVSLVMSWIVTSVHPHLTFTSCGHATLWANLRSVGPSIRHPFGTNSLFCFAHLSHLLIVQVSLSVFIHQFSAFHQSLSVGLSVCLSVCMSGYQKIKKTKLFKWKKVFAVLPLPSHLLLLYSYIQSYMACLFSDSIPEFIFYLARLLNKCSGQW